MQNRSFSLCILITTCLASFYSCVATDSGGRGRDTSNAFLSNDPNSLSFGHSRVIETNPVVQTGDPLLPVNSSLTPYLSSDQKFITNNPYLFRSCELEDPLNLGTNITVAPCMQVFQKPNLAPTTYISGRWGFDPSTDEFLEVNTYYHTSKAIDKFLDSITYAHTQAHLNPTLTYASAIPGDLIGQGAFWDNGRSLLAYSSCQDLGNAFFDPANFLLCFGVDPNNPGLVFSQDPSIIYHEAGHAFVKIMMNMRNNASSAVSSLSSDLGLTFYDEAGAINEGIADYFSYIFSERTRMGEWALGDFSRPLSEADGGHAPNIDTTFEGRLEYPRFLTYNSATPETPAEEIHFAGQIASHFLVALTQSLQNDCAQTHETATQNMLYLLAETLSELGDLTSQASDNNAVGSNHTNLQQSNTLGDAFLSYRWAHTVNPPNFRRFFQVFSKYFLQVFINNPNCNSTYYSKDEYEILLDAYGLLLFSTYNEDGNGYNASTETGHAGTPTQIDAGNRQKTVLVTKELIDFNPAANSTKAFIFDKRSDMVAVLSNLRFAGVPLDLSSQIPDDLGFNNGDGKISRGELIGVIPILYNASNSEIGGIQVLANDWDHGKKNASTNALEPCNTFADAFPSSTAGAADVSSDTTTTEGDCQHITKENGTTNEPLAPVCWVELAGENETKWVSQNEFRKDMDLDSSACLHNDGSYNNCLLNVVSGGDSATFSRIAPQQTWAETLLSNSTGVEDSLFSQSNLLIFEVNKSTPPGTLFQCRFRVRFSNCSDCFEDTDHNNDDFLDYEYSGGKPFKILNLQLRIGS